MDKLYALLLLLIGFTVVSVTCVLLYLSFPRAFDHAAIEWPQGPEEGLSVVSTVSRSPELEDGAGKVLIERHCLGCHNTRLIVQNRMDKEAWKSTIRWMQDSQGLWDLGNDESGILDYLATYYAPIPSGRRQNLDLDQIEWYILDSHKEISEINLLKLNL